MHRFFNANPNGYRLEWQDSPMHNDLASERRPPPDSPKDWRRIFLLGLVAVLVLYFGGSWIYHNFLMSEEDRIRAAITSAAQAAVDRSPADVSSLLSDDFRMPPGITKEQVHNALILVLLTRHRKISVNLSPDPIPVELDPKNKTLAHATFRAEVKGKINVDSEWRTINNRSGGTHYHATFRKTPDGWEMITVRIQP